MTTRTSPTRAGARDHRAAFTLVEIVLVITIIAVLGAAAIYKIKGIDVSDRCVLNTSCVKNSVSRRSPAGSSSPTLASTSSRSTLFAPKASSTASRWSRPVLSDVEMPTVEPVPGKWTQLLEEVPKDPWNHELRYVYPAKRSTQDYDVYSLGKDGVESADDIGNWKVARKD